MINSTRCAFMAKQACATFSKVVRKITPPHANNLLKFFFALFATLTLGAATAWAEDYSIKFLTNTTDGSTEITSSTMQSTVLENTSCSYVSGFTNNCTKAYYKGKSGVKLSSSNTSGTLELTLSDACNKNVSKIVFKTAKYNSEASTLTFYAGTSELGTVDAGNEFSYTFTEPQSISTLKISSSKRAYISGITISVNSALIPDSGTGETAIYTISSTTAVKTTGNVPQGSTATLSGTGSINGGFIQCTNGKNHTLTLTGYEGYKITGVTIHVKSNSSKGTGSFSVVAGSTTIASIAESAFNNTNWNGSWNTTGVDKTLTMTNDSYEIQSGENVTLTINCKSGSSSYNSLYVKSYTITYMPVTSSGGGTEEPVASLTADPTTIDFGTVYESATVADKTVAVNFVNLTDAVTYSGLSTPFSATGAISATGDKITISADASTIGAYSQTLTIASTADSKTAEVTVKMNVVEKPAPTGTFTLHTGDLIEGDYVIVSTNSLKAEVNSDRLASLPVTISNDEIVDPDATTIWHIAKSGEYWTLYNANKAKYAASTGAKNKAALLDDGSDDKALWSASGTSTYEFVNKKNTEAAVNANLRYNSQNAENSRWACYSTSTGAALSLYRKAGTKYNVNISATTNGTVTADPTSAEAGTTITLTVTPVGGYVLDALTVTDASSNPVTVTDNKFTMPASDVTVTATFKENEKPAATLTLSKNGVEEPFPGSWKQDDVVTLPTTVDTECVKEFVGWSADANCATEPEYAPGASYTLASTSQTLYAVYATVEGGEATASVDMATYANDNSWGSSSSTNQKEININSDLKAVISEGGNSGKYYDDGVRIYQSESATVTISTTVGELKSVKFTFTNSSDGTLLYGSTKLTSNTAIAVNGTSAVFTVSDTHATENKGQIRFTAIEVVYTGGVSYSNYSTTCAAAPIATVNPTSVTATAAGVEGKVTVTYENVNTENVAVALFNDAACTEAFTAGWLTADLDGDKNITYTVSATTLYTERKAYIQLTAPETTGATDPDVVVIPVTQAAKDKVFASLEALLAAITPTTEGVEVTVTLTNEVIQDFYTSSSYRNGIALNVPYQDGVKVIEIYCKDVPAEWVKGGKVSGTITCPWKLYNSTWELCPTAWTELTYTAPATVKSIAVSGTPTKTTYVDGEAFDPTGLVVTATLTDDSTEPIDVALVDWTFDPEILSKGETSVSVVATYNTMESAAYEVTGLTVNDILTKTVAEFIAAEGGRCYLEGIVSNITNTTYGNFDLTDASGTIYVYGCLNEAGEEQKFAALGVKNGDKIKVIADKYELYDDTKDEAIDVQYVSHISAATITISDITMEVGDTQAISATVTPEGASVSYAIKDGSDNCITLNGAEITATEAGTATIVATIAETADYLGATKEFTVTVTTPDTRKKAVSPSPFTAVSGDMNPNDITYTSYQGGAGNAPGTYNNGIRLYQISGTNTYGGYITLTAVKGCMIDQVEITTTDQYETTTVAYSVDDNVTLLGSASVAQLGKYSTPAGLNTESVNILNLGTTNKNRLEIASFIVYYTGQPLADPELSWTSNAVELRVGEAFTTPTLNNPYKVTGITYKSDNELLATVDASTGVVSLVPDATGTAIITATFAGDNTYKAVEASYTITVKPALVYGVWELVADVASLAAGDKVVVVAKDYNFALSINQGNNNRGQAEVTKNNDNTVAFGNDVQVLTLEAGSVEKTFALNTGNGYLYASSSSSNQLKTQAKKDDNASWNISIADGTATIVAQGSNTSNTMQYNQSSSLFACYASASQKAVCLYTKKNVKVEGETDNSTIPNQSDVTVDNAELTVTTEAEYDNMYIGNNGSVDVEEKVTVNNLYIQTTMGTTTSGQLNTAAENIIVNGDVFIDITLGKNGDPNQWHAFTVPFPVDAMNGIFDLNDNKLTNGVNYAIMQYHGDVRAQGKYGWKKYSGVLVPGTFYLMTVDGERTTYRFKKVKDAELIAPATKELKAYTGTGESTDYGWNGVGNPTLMHGKVDAPTQILDPETYTYITILASSAHFTVGTPFFIQADADATVTIAAEVSGSLAPARRAAAAVDKVKVMLGNADYTDYLYVSASEDATTEYEIGKDLVKMTMTSTPIVPQIFAHAYGTYLCMVNAPMISNEATVALNLYAPTEGEYTLSVEEQAGATVYLLYNGNIVWNLSMGEHSVHLSQGNNAGYSLVVRRENAPTDVENIFGADEQTEKFIYNGKLYILHEGKVFDAVGNVLK